MFRLTGKFVIDHYTAANSAPLYSAERRAWSDELAPDIIPLERLPDIAWTTDIVGAVTAKAAKETGLAEGTPVICGTVDAAAEAISVGVLEPRRHDADVWLHHLHHRRHIRARERRQAVVCAVAFSRPARIHGRSRNKRHAHPLVPRKLARELDPAPAIKELAAEAETSPPGAKGLVMLPYFSGERTPIHDTHAKGAIFGLNLTHTRGDLFRAALEGIALATNHIMETFDDAGEPPQNIFAVGGGTQNRVWAQATSDICGRTQILREKSMGASYGNAFLAALAVGDAQLKDIKTWNPVASEFTAKAENAEYLSQAL